MTELKVFCDCGQKYKFDVEPVDGRMPFTVACPVCGRDGTGKANEMLQQMTVFKAVESPPAPVAPAPAPTRLRIGASAAAVPAVSPPPPPPSFAAAPRLVPGSPPPIGSIGRRPVAAAAKTPGKPPNFGLGLLGGLLGALVGSVIYYSIFKATGYRIGLLAIGVGGLAGWGADLLGRGEGSKELGLITAILVMAGVVGAQYLVALGLWHQIVGNIEDAGYTESVQAAKAVVKAIPTGSDEEIRIYLAKQNLDDGETAKPAAVSNDEVKEFKEKELPEYRALASGEETKEKYMAKNGIDSEKLKKFQNEEEGTFKGVFFLLVFSKMGIISLIAGAGVAYKLSTNARGE